MGREDKRGASICERITRKMAKTVSAIQTQMENDTRLARTIPARKASENHISGSRDICSCTRFHVRGFVACIVPFMIAYHSKGKIQFLPSLRATERERSNLTLSYEI